MTTDTDIELKDIDFNPSSEDLAAKGDEIGIQGKNGYGKMEEKSEIRSEDRTREFHTLLGGNIKERDHRDIKGSYQRGEGEESEYAAGSMLREARSEMDFKEQVKGLIGKLGSFVAGGKRVRLSPQEKEERANWERYQYEQRTQNLELGQQVPNNDIGSPQNNK